MAKLYRAMCVEEAIATLRQQRTIFIRRFKWFSPNTGFVTSTVQNGVFGNSKFKPLRYTHVLEFEFEETSIHHFVRLNDNELMLDRRQAHKVRLTNITEV